MKLNIVWINTIELVGQYGSEIDQMADELDKDLVEYVPRELSDYIFAGSEDSWSISKWLKEKIQEKSTEYQYYLFQISDQVIGYCVLTYHKSSNILALSNVFIKKEYRRNGHAKEAITTLVNECKRTLKPKAVTLGVFTKNPAIKLYQSLGFKPYDQLMYLKL